MESRTHSRTWATAARHARLIVSAASILVLLAPDFAFAADRYWTGFANVGATAQDWHDTSNWGTAYDGSGTPAAVPTISDDVYFDRVAGGDLITIRNGAVAKSISFGRLFTGTVMLFTGSKLRVAGNNGIHMGSGYFIFNGTGALSFSGSLIQTGGVIGNGRAASVMQLSGSLITMQKGRFRYSGTIVFEGERDETFAYSGSYTSAVPPTQAVGRHSFSGITLNNVGGTTNDDLIVSGAVLHLRRLTITQGNFKLDGPDSSDNAAPSVPLALSGTITIASNAQATFSTDTNVRMSGSLSTGDAGRFALSGGTLTMNGIYQTLDAEGTHSNVHNLVVAANSGVVLGSTVLVQSTLTINASSTLTLGTNTLYLSGGTITNNGKIHKDTGKLIHTGSTVLIANSEYTPDHEIKTGETMYFTATNSAANLDGTAADTISATVSLAGGDSEALTLTETSSTSGIFRGSISVVNDTSTSNDGTLQTTADRTATFTYSHDGRTETYDAAVTVVGATSTTSGGGGGGGGTRSGGGSSNKKTVPATKNTEKPQPKVPVLKKVLKKLKSVEERKAERIKKLAEMKARKDARKAARKSSK